MRANQLRLWFASHGLRPARAPCAASGLQHTQFAEATCGTIRLKLLKIGALVRITVRRVKFAMASGCPYKAVIATAHRALNAAADWVLSGRRTSETNAFGYRKGGNL